MRLGLGTVQFGLDYGVSSTKGQTSRNEAARVLDVARRGGIEVLDTAAAYGDSESVLGGLLAPGASFRIVTKSKPGSSADRGGLRASLERSLKILGRDAVHGFLVHHVRELLGPDADAVYAELAALKSEGLTGGIGVSVYEGAQLDRVLERFDIDIAQVPVNVFDQRLVRTGHLARMKALGVEIHVRSVFLQGLALMDPETAPAFFEPIRHQLRSWREALAEAGLTAVQGALAYVRSLAEPDVVLVGVNTAEQLEVNISDFAQPLPNLDFSRFAIDEASFVTPSLWRLGDTS